MQSFKSLRERRSWGESKETATVQQKPSSAHRLFLALAKEESGTRRKGFSSEEKTVPGPLLLCPPGRTKTDFIDLEEEKSFSLFFHSPKN